MNEREIEDDILSEAADRYEDWNWL
jgi:hypothetical protein